MRLEVKMLHECYYCPTGEYAAAGSSTCESCPAGKFSLDSALFPGTGSCSVCESGTYKTTVGLNQPAYVIFSHSGGQLELPFDFTAGENLIGNRFAPSLVYGEYWSQIAPASRQLVVSSDPYGCSSWSPKIPGKIAFVKRGGFCGFSDKMMFAMRAHAVAVIIYNNRPQSSFRFPIFLSRYVSSFEDITIPGGMIHQELGEFLANTSVNVTVPSFCRVCPDNTTSAPGNVALTGCVCKEGYTGPPGGPCRKSKTFWHYCPGTFDCGRGKYLPPNITKNKTFWHYCPGTFDCARGEYLPPNITKNKTFWHPCAGTFDCARAEYLPPSIPTPIGTTPIGKKPSSSNSSCQDDVEWVHYVPNAPDVTCESRTSLAKAMPATNYTLVSVMRIILTPCLGSHNT
jgi:hypothetical protein